tara:strand:+ start:30 stop:194 length:165 start_codon:yes stop_codon:yes gene_type:complete
MMQRDREFDHAEPGAKVTAGARNLLNHILAHFVGDLGQVGVRQAAQIGERLYGI